MTSPISRYYSLSNSQCFSGEFRSTVNARGVEPDRSDIRRIFEACIDDQNYKGCRFSKNMEFNGKTCDILYLKKKPVQVDFEKRHQNYVSELVHATMTGKRPRKLFWREMDHWDYLNSALSYLCRFRSSIDRVSDTIIKQCHNASTYIKMFDENIRKCNYASYAIYTPEELRDFGVKEEELFTRHMIVLYHHQR